MKYFAKHFFIIIISAFTISLSIMAAAFYKQKNAVNYDIESNKHTLVIGSSLGETSINDSILSTYKNICKSGAAYWQYHNTVDSILSRNPQIDTLNIIAGPHNLFYICNKRLVSEPLSYLNYINIEILTHINNQDIHKLLLFRFHKFLPFLLLSGIQSFSSTFTEWGTFSKSKDHYLRSGAKVSCDKYQSYIESDFGKKFSLEDIIQNSSIQVKFLRELISIAKKHNVTCVLTTIPAYKYETFVPTQGYNDFIATLDDSVLVADYIDFQFPDTSYYSDVVHLSEKGAEYFSTHIKKYGLKTIPIGEWKKRHANISKRNT